MRRFGLLSKMVRLVLMVGVVGIILEACSPPSTILQPSANRVPPTPQTASFFAIGLKTSDGKVLIQLRITPNRLGTNQFLIDLKDATTGNPVTNEQAQIFTTMLDMDMATGVILLQPSSNGRYNAQGDLPMDGNWDIHIQLLDTTVHVAKVKVAVPA